MKRHRLNSNGICMIPRNAIAMIILSMAIMTILALILIEVRGFYSLSELSKRKDLQNLFAHKNNKTISKTTELSTSTVEISLNNALSKRSWSNEVVENLFEDHPQCSESPYLLILVASAPEHFDRRKAIRTSWANEDKWKLRVPGLKSKTIFLVGRSTEFLDVLVKNENEMSGDILIGKYLDSYRNLTMKVMHGLSWVHDYCQPDFLLKTDDDCFVNIPLLLEFLWKFNTVYENLYAGRVHWSSPVVRDPNSRWYVPSTDYPNPRYDPYANGAGYVLSRDALHKLIIFSTKLRVFPNEDAYVGAVLHLAGVRPTYSARFATHPGPWQICNYLYLFVVHRVKASLQGENQDMANKATEQCSMDSIVKDWV